MLLVALVLLVILIGTAFKLKKVNKHLKELEIQLKNAQEALQLKTQAFAAYQEKTAHLKQYEMIDDAKKESENIIERAESLRRESEVEYHKKVAEAQFLAAKEMSEAQISAAKEISKAKMQALKSKAESELKLAKAHEIATKIEYEARCKAHKNAENVSVES